MPLVDEIRPRLAACLDAEIAAMRVLASGWETTVFEFSLARPSPRVETPVGVPLVLRFYEGSRASEKGPREEATMRLLAGAGYPAPRPFLFEPDPAVLGAPFLIMERAAGGPLFSTRNFPQAFKTFSLGFPAFVRAQARLHRMGAAAFRIEGVPTAYRAAGCAGDSPLLERMLAIIAERVEHGPLPGLANALARLRTLAPRFREAPEAPLHMDYHPQNVLVAGTRVTGVIDWVNADRGDRHLCAATTAVILSCSAMDHPRWMRENAAGNTLRWTFASMYVPLYHALAPMQWERFRYCQAVAALLRLSMFGMMRAQGPEAVGFRPEAIGNVTPSVVRILSRYATRKSGVPVSIETA
jgi:aminoglycoside phosphotransferase (APT) family kinase protein